MVNLKIGLNLPSSKTSPLAFSSGKKNYKICSVLISAFLIYLIAASVVSAPAMAAYMYAADVDYNSPYGYFKKIDQGTGVATNVSSNPIGLPAWGEIMGMSASPDAGWLYGAEPYEDKLWRINVTTGVGEALGNFNQGINGLAYDPVNNVLYGTDYESLYTVNQSTGAATSVGAFGSGILNAFALDYDTATGRIYGVDAGLDKLFWADISTGVATLIGSTGRDRITDIAFDWQTGVLYGIENGQTSDYFFTVDKATGATTNIGTGMGEPINVKGLAKPIPEPTTFLLLGSGLLGLIGLVRKRSGRA